jgi:pyruvate/2-oxoglutarate/acetoin dehydrogenase E1 component
MIVDRVLTYAEAIHEGTRQEMERDPSVMIMGLGVDDFKGTYGTTKDLVDQFGKDRVMDTPISEDAMTGVAIGAALAGMRPVHVHIRMDFLLLAMNQLINIAAKSSYMFGGAVSVPIVVRSVIGKSWGQGAQHSQGLQSYFMHVPGLKVAAPATPYDAKGILVQSIRDNNPVVFVEHRMIHFQSGHVPEELYAAPFGKARVLEQGTDITLVGISYMAIECLRAKSLLKEVGINAEVIDPVTLSPLDMDTITKSARKSGHLLVVDCAWTNCGASAEIAVQAAEQVDGLGGNRLRRMGFAPVTCPTTKNLENLFYPTPDTIASTAYSMIYPNSKPWTPPHIDAPEILEFKGPF